MLASLPGSTQQNIAFAFPMTNTPTRHNTDEDVVINRNTHPPKVPQARAPDNALPCVGACTWPSLADGMSRDA